MSDTRWVADAATLARIAELERENAALVRWKGEIDSRRIVLGLPFPDDYDSSPKYAVETLIESTLAKSASREAELEALNNELMEANDEALKQVKASASREAALVEKLKVATDLLDEGNKGFGRILIATSDDKAVRDWQKRCGAALAKIKEPT